MSDPDSLLAAPAPDDTGFLAIPGALAELIRAKDWSATPLGPISGWPQSLRTTVSLCLASNVPVNIIWGPAATQIYNDGYRVLCGEKHPLALGMDYRACWASAWDALDAPFAAASVGNTSFLENQRMFLFRNGYLEETFFTFSLSPIRDESGGIGGLFHPVTETTTSIVGARRTRAVRDLTAHLAGAQTRADVYQRTIATVAGFAFDLPFVLLYERDARDGVFRRVGHAGIDLPAPLAPDVLDAAGWPLAQIGHATLEVAGLAARIGAAPCGPYEEAPDVGFAIPVHDAGTRTPVALMLTAASARLPLDDASRGFVELVGAAFGAALGRVMRLEEERERLASLAALVLAEDNADMRAYLERVLGDAGYHVTAVADGAIGLARHRREAAGRENALHLLIATRDSRAALERSEAQVTSLFAQTATGVLQAGLDGRIRKVNPRLCAMLGMQETELDGRTLATLVHADDDAAVGAVLAAMRASGEPAQLDVRLLRAGGGELWATLALTPIVSSDTLLAVVLDVSERVEAEQKLRRADRSKDEFLAMLAHELRNPLAPISAAAELMSRVQLDDIRLKRTSAVIARQVRHMTELVDDLLDVSRVTRGLVLVEKAPQDMKSVLNHAVEQVRPLIDAQRHALSIRISPASANVLGDHKRLVQVVGNLLNNAAKYTPPCGRIELELAVEQDTVTVSVGDNGIGIPTELQPRIFDLFAQAARAPDRSQGGLGLGLALARTLARLHGGDIICDSDGPGCGTRFVITLPRQADQQEANVAEAAGGGAAGAVRVLVVDDNVDAAAMIAMLLESFGYQALVEHDAPSGLARAVAERPDVCILDIGLPEMDGNELARRLRADPRTRDMVLIALTGYSQKKDRERSFLAGFDHHFAKPANIDKLAEVLVELTPRGHAVS